MSMDPFAYYTDAYGIWLFRVGGPYPESYDFVMEKWLPSRELFDVWGKPPFIMEITPDEAQWRIERRRRSRKSATP